MAAEHGTMARMQLPPNLPVTVLAGELAICGLPADASVAAGPDGACIYSVTRTAAETTVVCPADAAPPGARVERGWRALKVSQDLDFAQAGLLASLLDPLMRERVTVYVLSTYSTDYVLVKETDLAVAITALKVSDHPVDVAGEGPPGEPPPRRKGLPVTPME
jgi:hypothetical protein